MPNPDKPEPKQENSITKARRHESLNDILFRAFNLLCIAALALRRGVIVFYSRERMDGCATPLHVAPRAGARIETPW
jgi:hypothetical protein